MCFFNFEASEKNKIHIPLFHSLLFRVPGFKGSHNQQMQLQAIPIDELDLAIIGVKSNPWLPGKAFTNSVVLPAWPTDARDSIDIRVCIG